MAGVISTWCPVRCRFIYRSFSSRLAPLLSDRLAEVGRLDVHRLAVLGDGPAGHLDALLGEDVGDAMVGERFSPVFRGDELLDERTDGGRGTGASRVGGNVAAEEVLELA